MTSAKSLADAQETSESSGTAAAPVRIQLSRKKGWKMPANTIKVARPSKWGNPYAVERFTLPLAIELYSRSVTGYWSPSAIPDHLIDEAYALHTEFRQRFFSLDDTRNLRGWNLACWCPLHQPCHADVLLRLANA